MRNQQEMGRREQLWSSLSEGRAPHFRKSMAAAMAALGSFPAVA
jgi:hypothetical protein